jgi:uncharacterized membrane protein
MKVLFVLFLVFGLTLLGARLFSGHWNLFFSGNLAMFVMLCLTALGHFKFTEGMVMMMPQVIPFKKEIVYLSGIAEILLGLALLFPATRATSGYILILLFVLMLPANIHAAIKHIDFEKANYEGAGLTYLWFRIPMQVLLIAWVWYFAIRK